MFGSSKNKGEISALTNNALSQSTIGVKIEENIGMGFAAIGKIETGFNPLSGELSDGCKSLVELSNAVSNKTPIPSFGDSSRCGQALNGEVYAGVTNAAYGTLTIGRQNSLDLAAMANYDPMGLSYALSLIGYSGGAGGGVGSTEAARWDNSIKYSYQYGPAHAAVMYSDGAQDSAIHGSAWGVDAGVTWHGFSVDAIYTKENNTVNSLSGIAGGLDVNALEYWMSNNEAWTIMGKYVWDFGGGYKDGGCGLKDLCDSAKLTLYGGYQHTDMTAGDQGTALDGTTIGGYILADKVFSLLTTRTLETEWAGAKYETGPWAFTGAYYHFTQNAFVTTNGNCAANAGHCAGSYDQWSALVDYTFNKHFDVYAGVTDSTVSGGFAHSITSGAAYLATDNVTFVTGMRLKF